MAKWLRSLIRCGLRLQVRIVLFAICTSKKADLLIAENTYLRLIFFAFQNIQLFLCFLKKKEQMFSINF